MVSHGRSPATAFHTIHIFIFLLFFSSSTRADDTALQSISKFDGFGSQRPCVAGCFYDCKDRIGYALGCIPWACAIAQEHCFCRPDLQSIAYSFIGDCITSSCVPAGAITLDLQAASAIYSGYCSAAGYPNAAVATTAPKTTSSSPTSTKAAAAPSSTTSDTSPTPTTASPAQTSNSYIITTIPPATTTQVSTQPAVTLTKVLVSPSSASSISIMNLGMIILIALICGLQSQ